MLPRRRLVASSSVWGVEVSSTLLVIGLYQCMKSSPFPFLKEHLKAYLREGFYHQGAAKYGALGYIVLKSTERPPEEVGCHTKSVAPSPFVNRGYKALRPSPGEACNGHLSPLQDGR